MSATEYAITITPAERFDKFSLSQFLLLMTYLCQPKEVAGTKIIMMHKLLKESGKVTMSLSYEDMVTFKNNVVLFAPCLEPNKVSDFLNITESAIVADPTEAGADDTGLEQYLR